MAITDEQTLGSSCEWMEGMLWKAREFWKNKYNDPDGAEERSIYVYTKMPRMTTCYLIFPSTFYEILTGDAAFGGLREEPSFSLLTERVRALVETRAKAGARHEKNVETILRAGENGNAREKARGCHGMIRNDPGRAIGFFPDFFGASAARRAAACSAALCMRVFARLVFVRADSSVMRYG